MIREAFTRADALGKIAFHERKLEEISRARLEAIDRVFDEMVAPDDGRVALRGRCILPPIEFLRADVAVLTRGKTHPENPGRHKPKRRRKRRS